MHRYLQAPDDLPVAVVVLHKMMQRADASPPRFVTGVHGARKPLPLPELLLEVDRQLALGWALKLKEWNHELAFISLRLFTDKVICKFHN